MIRMEVSAQVGSVKRLAEVARLQADRHSPAAIRALCDALDRLCGIAEGLADELSELRRATSEKRQ